MDVTTSFKIGAAVWDGDKFLIETATDGSMPVLAATSRYGWESATTIRG